MALLVAVPVWGRMRPEKALPEPDAPAKTEALVAKFAVTLRGLVGMVKEATFPVTVAPVGSPDQLTKA